MRKTATVLLFVVGGCTAVSALTAAVEERWVSVFGFGIMTGVIFVDAARLYRRNFTRRCRSREAAVHLVKR